MSEAHPSLLYDSRNGVARLTLNRPEKRNALDSALVESLGRAVDRAEADPEVRVIALSGAGEDFCAGADLRALQGMLDAPVLENLEDAERLGRLFVRFRRGTKPIVALVRGRALAGGCGLATACDLVLAGSDARFGYTEISLGFVPAMVMAIISRNVTEKRAFEMITTGEIYTAEEFERFGLVNRVWPADRFDEQADAFLASLSARDAGALNLSKRLLYRQDDLGFEAAVSAGAEVNVIARMTEGLRRGVAEFFNAREGRER